MSDSQNDPKDSTTNSQSAARTERAVRQSNISLADQRRSGRTLGFLGLSTAGHVAILVALASVPMAVHEMNNGGNKPAGANEVSMVDTSGDSAKIAATAMTDATSDIAMSPAQKSQEKTESKPVQESEPKIEAAITPLPEKKTRLAKKPAIPKPIAKAKASAPVRTEETQQEAPPVLLANPPGDDAQPDEQTTESVQAVAVPVIEATIEQAEAKPQPVPAPQEQQIEEVSAAEEAPVPVSDQKSPVAEKHSAVVAAAKRSAPESNSKESDESASTEAALSDSSISTSSAGEGSQNQSSQGESGTVGAVAGPIRDASELKALSGNPNPVYPARDRLAHKEGTAVILGRVSPDGRIVETTLERSSGSANMDAASIQAFRGWRFQAGQQGWVRKPFQFRLVGEAKEVPAPLGKGLKR